MPYLRYNTMRDGKPVYCIKNIKTGKKTCFSTKDSREDGIRLREAIAHGFKPTKVNVTSHNRENNKTKWGVTRHTRTLR